MINWPEGLFYNSLPKLPKLVNYSFSKYLFFLKNQLNPANDLGKNFYYWNLHIVLFFKHIVFKNCSKFLSVLFRILVGDFRNKLDSIFDQWQWQNLCRKANSVNMLQSDYIDINLYYSILFLIFQKKEIRRQTKRRIQPHNLRLKMARHLMRW